MEELYGTTEQPISAMKTRDSGLTGHIQLTLELSLLDFKADNVPKTLRDSGLRCGCNAPTSIMQTYATRSFKILLG